MGSPSPSSVPKLKRSSSTSRAGPHRRSSSSITSSSCVSLESGDQDLLQYSSPAKNVTGTAKSTVSSSPRTPAAGAASPAALKKRRSSIGGLDDLAKGLDFSNSSSSPGNEEKKLHSFLTKGGGHKKVSPAVAQASSSPGKKTGPALGKEKITVAGRATLSPRKSSEGREISKKVDMPSSPQKVPEVSRSVNGVTTPKKSSPLRASSDGKILGKLSSPRLTPKSLASSIKGRTSELAAADAFLEGDLINQFKKTERKPSPSPSLRSKSSSAGRKLTPSPPQLGRARTRTDNHAELSRPEMELVTVYSEYEFDRDSAKRTSDHINVTQHDEEAEERSTLLASLIRVSGNNMNGGGETLDHEPTSWLSEDNVCMFSSLSQLPEPDDICLLGDPPMKTMDEPVSSNGFRLDAATPTSMVSSPKSPVCEVSNGVYDQHGSVDHELNSFCDMLDDPDDGFEAQLCTQRDAAFKSSPQVEDPVDMFEAELRTQIETAFDSPQLSVPQFVVPAAITSSVDKGETILVSEDVSSDKQSTVVIEAFLQSCSSQVTEDLQTGEAQSQAISNQGPSEVAPKLSFLEGVEEILQLDQFAEHSISAPNVRRPIVEDEVSTTHSYSTDQQVVESSDDESLEDITEDSQLNLKQSFDDVAESQNRVDEIDISDHADVVPVMVISPREHASLEPYAIGLQELALSTESEFAPQFLDGPTYNLDQDMKIFEEDWTQSTTEESDAGQNDAEDLLLNIGEGEAENSLPPVKLPVSVLPVTGKLKVTVEESEPHATKLEIVEEIPPKDGPDATVSLDNHRAEVGATKVENAEEIPPKDGPDATVSLDNYIAEVGATKVENAGEIPPKGGPDAILSLDNYIAEVGATKVEIAEEIPPKEGPDATVSLDNYQVNGTYQKEDEESDEIFHLYGAVSKEDILFDHLSSPSRPEDVIQEPLNPMFEGTGESDSHVVDTTQMELDAQNRDHVEHPEFPIKEFPPHDTSGDDMLHDSIPGTGEVCADQAPLNHEAPPISSNALNGVHNIQYLENDDHSEYLHLEGADLSLGTTIHDSSFETLVLSERQIAYVQSSEDLEPRAENPLTPDFYASCVQAGDGDRNVSAQDDCSHISPEKEFSGPPVVEVAAETDEISHDLDLKISPEVEGDQTALDPSDFDALIPVGGFNIDKELLLEASVMEEESFHGEDETTTSCGETIENSTLGQAEVQFNLEHQGLHNSEEGADILIRNLDKEHVTDASVMEEESFHEEFRSDGTTTRQERIENSIFGPEVQLIFDQEEHQGLYISEEGADILEFKSSELRDNSFRDMSSTPRDIEVPGQDSSQIYADEEFQEDERISASAVVESSHGEVNMTEVDHNELSSSPISVTLEDCSATDDKSVCASTEKSLPKGVHDESNTVVACIPEDDTIPDEFDAESEVISTASLDIGTEAPTASRTDIPGKDEVPFVFSAKKAPLNEVNEFDRHDQTIREVSEESFVCGDDHAKVGNILLGEQSKVEQDSKEIKPLLTVDSTEDQWDPLNEESNVFHGRANPCSPTQDSIITNAIGDTTDQDLVIDEASSIISAAPSELADHHDPDFQETKFLKFGTSISSDDQEDASEVEKALSDANFDGDLLEDCHAIKDAEIISGNSSSLDVPLKFCQNTPNAVGERTKEDIIPEFSWKGDTKAESLEQNLSLEDVDNNVEKLFLLSDQDVISLDVEREEYSRENVYLNGEPILSEDEEKEVFSPKDSNGCAFLGPDTKIMDISGPIDEGEDEDVADKSFLEVEETSAGANDPIADSEEDYFEKQTFLKDEDMAIESSKDSDVEQSDSSWNSSVCKTKDVLEDEENGVDNVVMQETPETRVLDVCDVENHSYVSWSTADNDELESSNGSCLEEESMLEEDEDTVEYRSMESLVESSQDLPDSIPPLVDEGHSEKTEPEEVKLNGEVVSEVENTISKAEEATPRVEEEMVEAQEMVMDNHEELPLVVGNDTNLESSMMVDEETNEEEETVNEDIVEKESMVEMVDHSPTSEPCIAPDVLHASAEKIDVEEEIQHPTWRTDEGGETLLEDRSMIEEKKASCPTESLAISDEDSTNAAISDVEEIQHPLWRTDEEGETLPEDRYMFEENEVSKHKESHVTLAEENSNATISDVEKEIQHPTWRTDEEGEALLEVRSMFEEKEASCHKESLAISDEENTNHADVSEADEEESTPNGNLEEETVVQLKDQENSSSGHMLECQVPDSVIESLQSDDMGEELECHSNGAMTSAKEAVDISEEAVKVEEVEVSGPKESHIISDEDNTDADVSDADEGESTSNGNVEEETVVQSKDQENSSSGTVMTVCQVPDSVNVSLQSTSPDYTGDELEHHSNGALTSYNDAVDIISTGAAKVEKPHTDHVDEGQFINEESHESETLALVKETWISNLERTPQDMDSPDEEPQALYPLQPPFSGSKQDHLWEEQAEAYSSGGRGTPSHKAAAGPASSEAQPFSCDDQIQPASGSLPSIEPKGKEKLHTPLRSLLLEDAHKGMDGDPSTPNGSPSFIRRLFRVKSTPSRAASERDLSHSKLKKSSSMWVSCLGSPQVKQ